MGSCVRGVAELSRSLRDTPQEPYRPHFHEAGFNALFFLFAAHSWARDLRIVNADYGVGLDHAHFCTVEDVELTTDFRRDTMSPGMCCLRYR